MNPALEELLRDHMGFAPETVGHVVLEKIIRRCVADSGSRSIDDYVERVKNDPQELLRLVDAVVVPETWFFRDPEAFTALSNWVLRDWLPRNPLGVLRILSLPCSTG